MKLTFVVLSTLVVALANCECNNIPAESSNASLNYRLPNETYPKYYEIILNLTQVGIAEKAFQGKVVIDILVRNDTKSITLHAGEDIKISNATILNLSASVSEELNYEYEVTREFLELTRKNNDKFSSGTNWRLTIIYSGKLSDDGNGLGLKKYIDGDGKEHYYAQSNFEGTYARRTFPCYDEPSQRTKFSITIHHSENYTAVSKAGPNERLSSKGKTVFLTTYPIPTYAVQIYVSDLVIKKTEDLNGILHNYYYPPSMEFNLNSRANITSMLIKYLYEYTGREWLGRLLNDFPFNNDGSISSDEGSNNNVMKYRIDAFSEQFSLLFCTDHITLQWWNHVWLKNGLATLFWKKALDNIYPEWHWLEEFQKVYYENILSAEGPNSTSPLTFYVQKPYEIAKVKYLPHTGHKAFFVLLMWNHALTEEVFQKGVQNFLNYSQSNAVTEDDFFAAMQKAAEEKNYPLPATVRQMMSTWTQQGGYPLLTITRDYESGNFMVKQEPYGSDETLKGNSWYVPFNYATASKHNFSDTHVTHYLLNESEREVDADIPKDNWLLVNKQLFGLYRIQYDEENYRLLTESLKTEYPFKIPAGNRAQLMNDVSSLCFSNRLNHSILLNMLAYLKKEDHYWPWYQANSIIKKYNHYLSDEDDFKWFATELIRPIFNKLSVIDEQFAGYERALILKTACSLGIKECLHQTNNELEAIIDGSADASSFLRWSPYCDGLRQSSDGQFDFFYQKLLNTTDKVERTNLISGLPCSRNENHIMKFLNASIDYSNELSLDDRITLLRHADRRNKVASLALIKFLKTNWRVIANFADKKSNSFSLSKFIRRVSKDVFSQDVKEKLLELVSEVIKFSAEAEADLEENVNKNIAINFKWLEEHGQPIILWIKRYRAQIENCNI